MSETSNLGHDMGVCIMYGRGRGQTYQRRHHSGVSEPLHKSFIFWSVQSSAVYHEKIKQQDQSHTVGKTETDQIFGSPKPIFDRHSLKIRKHQDSSSFCQKPKVPGKGESLKEAKEAASQLKKKEERREAPFRIGKRCMNKKSTVDEEEQGVPYLHSVADHVAGAPLLKFASDMPLDLSCDIIL